MPAQSNCSGRSDESGGIELEQDRRLGHRQQRAEPDGKTGTAWHRLYAHSVPNEQEAIFELARAVGTKVRWRDYRDRFLARR